MIRALSLAALLAGVSAAAIIEGSIVEARSGKPLARSTVTLETIRSGSAIPTATVLSDTAGRFSFPKLQPGAYRVRGQRTGFLTGYYGAGRSGSPIVLESESRFAAEVRLQRAAAILGEVHDENQVGLPGVTVQAFAAGVFPLHAAATALTDDRGTFRLSGLAPGRYWVRTAARELEDRQGVLPTFLGQATRAALGRSVAVEAEEEVGAGAIQVIFGRLGRIQGRVNGAGPLLVMLFTDAGKRELAPAGDGTFAFDQLAPGTYELLAVGAESLAGWRRIQVGEGATGVVIELGPMPAVTVRSQPEARVLVRLTRTGDSHQMPAPPAISGAIQYILPGEYTAVATPPPGAYVQSLEPERFTVAPGETVELAVTLSTNPAKITGMVRMPGGGVAGAAPVFLYPSDPRVRERLGGVRRTFAADDGKFGFDGLPPGTYFVFSAFDAPEAVAGDPLEFAQPRHPSKSVTVGEGGEVAIDLEVVPEP